MENYAADFETTTDKEDCRVWAWGCCNVKDLKSFEYGNDLSDFMLWCEHVGGNVYFHNLAFDGEFILKWLFDNGYEYVENPKEMCDKTFNIMMSDMNQLYKIVVVFRKQGKCINKVTYYDSLKLLPFTVEKVARCFNMEISKLEIDYDAKREIGHILTEQEVAYLHNDVVIMANALQTLFKQGLNKMTIGGNAFAEYKEKVGKKTFRTIFPEPYYDKDIRMTYRGGFTYLVPEYSEVDFKDGIVLDVNSLYPSVMYYEKLPYGEGIAFEGEYVPDCLYPLYVQLITCTFELKEGHIPTVQLKNNPRYRGNEYLTDCDELTPLYFTSVDLELFLEQYNVYDLTYIRGWKFKASNTLFREYIDHWNQVKVEATLENNAGMRTIAKLMLNNLYGKFALNPRVQNKHPYLDGGIVKYYVSEETTREANYIPVGTFITAWARNKTIRSAQSVYERFIYADTDSLHLKGTELPSNLEIDHTKLGAWDCERVFTRARFLRQKAYAEEVDGKMEVTCSGMPKSCYQYVTWENFHLGQVYPGKLTKKHCIGGIVLEPTTFTLRA